MQSIRHMRRQGRSGTELNMAPLIDMIFILLIFFLVTTSFVKDAGVEVERPKAQTAVNEEKAGLVIAVTKDGLIYVRGKPVDIRSIQKTVQEFLAGSPGKSVLIAADRNSRTGLAVRVMDACRLAGAKNIGLAARRPEN